MPLGGYEGNEYFVLEAAGICLVRADEGQRSSLTVGSRNTFGARQIVHWGSGHECDSRTGGSPSTRI